MSETTESHLFAVRTTGGQEKMVLRLLEAKMRSGESVSYTHLRAHET